MADKDFRVKNGLLVGGNVGIGTTSPAYKLDVTGDIRASANIYGTIATASQPNITANNTSFVGSVSAVNVVSNSQLSSNLANYQTTAGLSANVAKLTANNTTYLNEQLASYYTNSTNMTTGTLPYARLGSAVVNTSGNFTLAGNVNFTGTNNQFGSGGISTDGNIIANGYVQAANSMYIGGANVSIRSAYSLNVMGFYTNNAEQVCISATGNVGIGVTSPTVKLDVAGTIWSRPGNTVGGIAILTADATSGANGISLSASFATGGYGPIKFLTSNNEAMRITSAGYVGIGTANPAAPLEVSSSGYTSILATTTSITGTNVAVLRVKTPSASFGWYSPDTTNSFALYDYNGNANRICVDSGGSVFVNTSGHPNATFSAYFTVNAGVGYASTYFSSSSPGSYSALVFLGTSQSLAGYVNISGTTTTYNSVSDYRLKDDIAPMTGGLSKINALRPVTYKWRIDGSDGEGFVAHELQAIVPFAVTGEKDAVNKDGSIKAQGVDAAKVVAHLVAAVQELSAKNDVLEARLAALEAK